MIIMLHFFNENLNLNYRSLKIRDEDYILNNLNNKYFDS